MRRNRQKQATTEPSTAQIERIIAEQMQCLPPWWEADTKRMNPPRDGLTIPVIHLEPRMRWLARTEGERQAA